MQRIACWIILLWATSAAIAGDSTAAFSRSFAEPIRVSGFGLDSRKVAELKAGDIASLEAAKSTLGQFFRKLMEPGADLLGLTTAAYAHSYHDQMAMRKALIDPETSILEVGVTDFNLQQNGRSVELHFYALVSSEGMLAANEGSAELTAGAGAWRINKLKINQQ
jgi:hypothetical protein